ncbi:WD40/YVTN/BNR-like repeat-containing protein [Luteitalea sp.]
MIAPSDRRVVYQPTFHDVIRSLDAGRRWERVVPSVAPECYGPLTIHPAHAMWLFCSNEDRLSSSRDGGRTWNASGSRLPARPTTPLVISQIEPDEFLLGGEDGHLWRSRDAGRTWTRVDVDTGDGRMSAGGAQDEWTSIAYVDATNDMLIALRGDRIVRSRDAGEHWEPLASPASSMPEVFAVDPSDPWTVYVGTSSGVSVTRDFGQTWTRRSAGISRITVSVALHEGPTATTLYAISSEWSDAAEMFASRDGGQTWEAGVPSSMPLDVAAHTLRSDGFGGLTVSAGGQYHHLRRGHSRWLPLDLPPDTRLLPVDLASQALLLVAAGPDGYLLSDDGGRSWQRGQLPGARGPSAVAATVGRGRMLFMSRMALPFITGTDALPTNVGTWRSLDNGRTWEPTGPLLDMHRFETVQTDPHADGTVFVSATGVNSDRAVIHRSTDRGGTWKELHVPGLASALVLVPTRPTTLLALTVAGGQGGPLMASTDAGTSWRPAGAGLPHGVRLTNIVSDPRAPQRIFAGTRGRGVYRSTDAGATWTPAGTATSHDK